MRFNSLVYVLFLVAVVSVLWILPQKYKRHWLLIGSYVFYGSWHYPYLLLLIAVTAINQQGAYWIVKGDLKKRGGIIIALNLLVLGLFKYLDWMVTNLNLVASLFEVEPFELPRWVLPLGISFYVFECISYVVDLMRKREKPHRFWDFQLYITFFPHLIAGPIMRAKEFIPQLKSELSINAESLRSGLGMLLSGMFVKIVLADGLAGSVDQAFARPYASLSSLDVAVMATGFGLQIYFDFSAYTRIAIGSAKLCGLDLVENFNHPYVAQSPAEFWNRWHMSLSRWIRDYLFYPLVGKQATLLAMSKAAIIAMTLCGIWHGAGWPFVLWGLYHGLVLAAYHALTFNRRNKKASAAPSLWSRLEEPAAIISTFAVVTAGWIFFRSSSLNQAFGLFGRLLTPWSSTSRALSGMFYLHVAVLTVGVWAMPLAGRIVERLWKRRQEGSIGFAILEGGIAGLCIALCLVYLKGQSSFIYFQF